MADERIIQYADLRTIERNLQSIGGDLQSIDGNLKTLDNNVGTVNSNVKVVYDELGALAQQFHDFVLAQNAANNLHEAKADLITVRQELEKQFGHYDIVRRTTTGILQANDLGIVRQETISTATEELMLSAPRYWLAPCLVALAAWISDQKELADKAVREAIRRNDEKTSLFFALICRRADRKQACLKWTQRYLANQDEENLDRNAIIILDAFASGLLGSDSEGVVSRQMGEWMDHLSEQLGFTEQQTKQWSDAINLKRKPLQDDSYTYLRKYSKTWPILQDILEGANLHADILAYFEGIFDQEASTDTLKEQLDDILNSLVTDFDDEELPLRRREREDELIVQYRGDKSRAQHDMAIEQTAFEEQKDFTQLLTDAAMKPESSHASVSTQKFAIALSKEWITDAYNDVVAQNRMKIPNEIEINVDSFNDKTTDGQDENEIVGRFNRQIDTEKANALAQVILSSFDKFCLVGGAAIAAIGLVMTIAGSVLLGIIAVIAGVAMILNYFSKKKKVETTRQNIESQFENKRTNGIQVIRALLAEIVDFRGEFAQKDGESEKVTAFLEQITPDQYVRKLADSNRRIKVNR